MRASTTVPGLSSRTLHARGGVATGAVGRLRRYVASKEMIPGVSLLLSRLSAHLVGFLSTQRLHTHGARLDLHCRRIMEAGLWLMNTDGPAALSKAITAIGPARRPGSMLSEPIVRS